MAMSIFPSLAGHVSKGKRTGRRCMAVRKLIVALVLTASLVAVIATAASAGGGPTAVEPQIVDDSTLKAMTTTEGGADVVPSTRTIPHWFGQATNPVDG